MPCGPAKKMVGGDNHEEAVMTIEQRLERLERRANRYRNALVMLVMSVCCVALIGPTTDDGIIRGKELFITNDEGRSLIIAGQSDDSENGLLVVFSKTGKDLIYAGTDKGGADGDGILTVSSKTGKDLIYAGAGKSGNGFFFEGFNKTGEGVVQLYADEYGNGVVGAYNRKGKGRTLESGP